MSTEQTKIEGGEQATEVFKSITIHPGDDEASLLQQRDEVERAIQLGARADPNYKLPWGETITEYKRRVAQQQSEQGRKAVDDNDANMRAQSTAGDPLYREGGVVRFEQSGASAIIEAAPPPPVPVDASKVGPERREVENPGGEKTPDTGSQS